MFGSLAKSSGTLSAVIESRFRDVLEAVKDIPAVNSTVEDIAQDVKTLVLRM